MNNSKLKAPRFKTYAIWLFFIFAAGVLIVGNLLWLNLVLRDSAENVSKIQLAVARQAGEVAKNFVEQLTDDVLQKTANLLIGEGIEKSRQVLKDLIEDNEAYFASIVLYDKEGTELVHSYRLEVEHLKDLFKPISQQGLNNALNNKQWYGKTEFLEGFGPVLSIIVPVRSKNGVEGALAANINLKVLANRLKDFKPGKNGQTYIVDQNGRIISHSNYFLVLAGDDWFSRSVVQKIIQQKEDVDGLNNNDRYFNEIGLEVRAAGLYLPTLDWGVVVEQPLFEIDAPVNKILTFGLISLGIGLFLIIVLNINFLILGRTGAALEKERDRISAIVSYLTDGLIQYDSNFRIQLVNPMAEEILGIKESDIKGEVITRDFDVKKNNPKLKPLVDVVFAGLDNKDKKDFAKNKYPLSEVFLKEPQERWLKIATVPVSDYQGNVFGFIKVMHDISRERVVAKMKSEFISIAAHQLRTPLAAIKWTLRMILDGEIGGHVNVEQQKFIEQGYESNERMIRLINDMLNVSRIEEGRFGYEFVKTDFIALLEKNIVDFQLAARSKNIDLVFEKPSATVPDLTIDLSKINLVVQNLIDNAIKYSLTNGKIIIHAEEMKNRPFLLVSVKDHGVGIPTHQMGRIFTKFFRADNVILLQTEGTGLGLFIVKNIVKRHGGDIWVESQEEKGATFYFTLPLDEKMIPKLESPFQELIA